MDLQPGARAKRVLIVEDEALVAMLLEDMLDDAGHQVAFCASSIPQGRDYITREADSFDFAILDVNLGGQPIFPVAEALAGKQKRFAFATGYGPAGLPEGWRNRPTLSKPFGAQDVLRVLEADG
jgi:CheY-like chemotaxis protein